MQRRSLALLCLAVLVPLALASCNPTAPTTPAEEADTAWRQAAPGVEWREITFSPAGAARSATAFAARLEPAAAILRVHYAPGEPRSITDWAGQTGAQFLINGSLFTPEDLAMGLLVSDGRFFGQSFVGYGGMFQVSGGWPRVRSLAAEPYWPGEPIDQAVQTFPMLLTPGGLPAYPSKPGDRPARRSIVGQDRAGRLVFIAVLSGGLTLHETSQWLAATDFDLDIALNLDGGGSTALYLSTGSAQRLVASFDPLPVVIAAYLR
jgi:uncharacterized protein YigE (DUF2233 family)